MYYISFFFSCSFSLFPVSLTRDISDKSLIESLFPLPLDLEYFFQHFLMKAMCFLLFGCFFFCTSLNRLLVYVLCCDFIWPKACFCVSESTTTCCLPVGVCCFGRDTNDCCCSIQLRYLIVSVVCARCFKKVGLWSFFFVCLFFVRYYVKHYYLQFSFFA